MINVTTNISSRLSVNSLLGINMMMILGRYRFAISSAAYQKLQHKSSYKWPETARLGKESALQYMGMGSQNINLDGTIYPSFQGGLRQISLMRAQAGKGEPLILVSGNGHVFGRWCIVGINETQTVFLKDGSPRKIEFSLSLKRYGEDKKRGIAGIVSV